MLVFRVCGVRQNLYVYSLYRNSDLDDRIFDCLVASMAAVQAVDVRASFLFVGDLNGHHQEWLGSTTMNPHGVAAFDFATVSGCDQLVVGLTHVRGGILDLLMTDVPDLLRVAVVAPIGNSDHFWVPVMHFCVCPIHCRVHWRMGRRLGSCRLTSVQLLIWSTIWAFSISSTLWVLEVLSSLY